MQPDPSSHAPVNHIFVDYENVKQVDLSVVGRKGFIVHLFLGPQNKKLDVATVERLLDLVDEMVTASADMDATLRLMFRRGLSGDQGAVAFRRRTMEVQE